MGDVVDFPGVTKLDIPPEKVLSAAMKADFSEVIIIGFVNNDEERFYFATSKNNGPDNLWLLEIAKSRLMRVFDE